MSEIYFEKRLHACDERNMWVLFWKGAADLSLYYSESRNMTEPLEPKMVLHGGTISGSTKNLSNQGYLKNP